MSQSDVDHFVSMVSGCEGIAAGDYKGSDSLYALSVLKMHAVDSGLVSGSEGFIDSIKSKAKSVKEFVLKVIKYVMDSIYMVLGGRSKVKAKLAAFKRAVTPEVFQNKTKRAAEDVIIPSLKACERILDNIIEIEYQDFHNNVLEETPEIRSFFIDNHHIEILVGKKIREAESNPTEKSLELDDVLSLINKTVNKGKVILTDLLKDEDKNRKVIKNLTSVMGKYNRIIEGLGLTNDKLEEMLK